MKADCDGWPRGGVASWPSEVVVTMTSSLISATHKSTVSTTNMHDIMGTADSSVFFFVFAVPFRCREAHTTVCFSSLEQTGRFRKHGLHPLIPCRSMVI